MASSASSLSTVWALNTVSGVVAQVPAFLLDHPLFKENLVEVAPFTKSYDSKMWKPTTAEEYSARETKARKPKDTNDEDKK